MRSGAQEGLCLALGGIYGLKRVSLFLGLGGGSIVEIIEVGSVGAEVPLSLVPIWFCGVVTPNPKT